MVKEEELLSVQARVDEMEGEIAQLRTSKDGLNPLGSGCGREIRCRGSPC